MFLVFQKILIVISLYVFFNIVFFMPVLAENIIINPLKSKSITVVVLEDFPPLYSLNNKNNPQGFAIDIVEHVAK